MIVRTMAAPEVAMALDWAAAEGWNPGLGDAEAFHASDPGGFLVAEHDGEPAAVVSVVRHDDDVAFLGLYICRFDLRGRGLGMAAWRAGMALAAGRTLGLDGVPAQQANYARSGFAPSHRNVRWQGAPRSLPDAPLLCDPAVDVTEADYAAIGAYDAGVTGYARPAFLRAWLTPRDGRRAKALRRGDRVVGYGVIRACREGAKIGPLFADAPDDAATLAAGLIAAAPTGPVALDAPEPNEPARALAEALGLAPVFETARMWRGAAPAEDLARVYGVATFELG